MFSTKTNICNQNTLGNYKQKLNYFTAMSVIIHVIIKIKSYKEKNAVTAERFHGNAPFQNTCHSE